MYLFAQGQGVVAVAKSFLQSSQNKRFFFQLNSKDNKHLPPLVRLGKTAVQLPFTPGTTRQEPSSG